MPEPKLAGKVALVTGAARGIGRAIALELAGGGADVVVNDKGHAELAAGVVREIEALGRRAFFSQGDVGIRAHDERMFSETVARFGRLDILVSNAGKGLRKAMLDLEVADVESQMSVLFWGAFHCGQLAARQFVRQGGGGNIVCITSVHAFRPYPAASIYNAGKAAVSHMAATWAVELAPHGIRVNCIEPGWTDTPGEHEQFSNEQIAEWGPQLLLGRLARPEEIAKGVAYLVSDDASYVTGTVLRIDGGFVLPNPR
jgi:glucose 1-dehydrogenase